MDSLRIFSRQSLLLLLVVCLICSFSYLPAGARPPHPRGKTIWSGTSGGYYWKWTTEDVTARRSVTSAQTKFSLNKQERPNYDPTWRDYEFKMTVLSVVGPIVSYKAETYYDGGGAHPGGDTEFRAVDVGNPAHSVSLADLFPDQDLLKALLADTVIQKTMAENGLKQKPSTTAELVKMLTMKLTPLTENGDFEFESDFLNRFALRDVRNGMVSVRICLSGGGGANRYMYTQLGLTLPIPPLLRTPLRLSATRQEGFLMRDSAAVSHGLLTYLKYGPH